MSKKTYVLDTSAILSDWRVVSSLGDADIYVPFVVLEELDKHKNRQGTVGFSARNFIRFLDELSIKNDLKTGASLGDGKGSLFVLFNSKQIEETNDNEILRMAAQNNATLLSQDINLRVKAACLSIGAESYSQDSVIHQSSELYSGFSEYVVADDLIDDMFKDYEIYASDFTDDVLTSNQYLMLISEEKQTKTVLARFKENDLPLKKLSNFKDGVWGLKPRNREQQFALDSLLEEDSALVTLVGISGSGKTLLAIAAGLHQVLETKRYKKLIVARPVQPVGKDIGFLPGNVQEKMLPWLAPIQDNLQNLLGGKTSLEMYLENGIIEIEPLTYIRGRSISDAFFILDESQNISKHELKTILTRIGENSKIVLTGDIEQIDNSILDETNNGLSSCVESFKSYSLASHVTLLKGERSKLSRLAAQIL